MSNESSPKEREYDIDVQRFRQFTDIIQNGFEELRKELDENKEELEVARDDLHHVENKLEMLRRNSARKESILFTLVIILGIYFGITIGVFLANNIIQHLINS